MNKLRRTMLLGSALVLLAVGGAIPVLAADKPIEISFSNFFPAPHNNSILAEEWAKAVG